MHTSLSADECDLECELVWLQGLHSLSFSQECKLVVSNTGIGLIVNIIARTVTNMLIKRRLV